MATWDPAQYLNFADHRLRPALELLARIPVDSPVRVVDLGCGPGNVTRYLRERWPLAEITGLDSSAEMLARAREADRSIQWEQADFGTWQPAQPPQVIYANAALHWLGDHAALIARLMGFLAPEGVLAVQMPRNFREPSHAMMADAAHGGPWAKRVTGLLRPPPVEEPQFYYDVLAPLSRRLDIWETRYLQVLSGENPVAEFTKGSWLKPLLDALEEPERSAFEADYRRRIAQAYPRREDGTTLFPFQRLFIVAVK
ncbi:MAG TPA: methyltransferase domain-containing protein [bacterium]|nr:methyltransferase domain-containing protein [bacterium]